MRETSFTRDKFIGKAHIVGSDAGVYDQIEEFSVEGDVNSQQANECEINDLQKDGFLENESQDSSSLGSRTKSQKEILKADSFKSSQDLDETIV